MKELTEKQLLALELLTCGKGLSYKEIAETVGVDSKTLWTWRKSPDFVNFQARLEEINHERWMATVDAARAGALRLCEKDNQKMIEFVLKNEGYNPTTKVEAEVSTNIEINIEE